MTATTPTGSRTGPTSFDSSSYVRSTMVTHNAPYAAPATHGAPLTGRAAEVIAAEGQYTLTQILSIWAAAAIPMALLAWAGPAAVGDRLDLGVGQENRAAFTRAGFITLGLV